MDNPVALYESQLRLIPDVCADPWFAREMAASRAGDEGAWRRISGSCLRLVFDIARRKWRPDCSIPLLELVQEGNVVLVRTIKQFKGATAEQFIREVTERVEHRLTLLLEHPELLE